MQKIVRKDREDYKPEPLCNAYSYWLYIYNRERVQMLHYIICERV